jgi:hypothetical protein
MSRRKVRTSCSRTGAVLSARSSREAALAEAQSPPAASCKELYLAIANDTGSWRGVAGVMSELASQNTRELFRHLDADQDGVLTEEVRAGGLLTCCRLVCKAEIRVAACRLTKARVGISAPRHEQGWALRYG